MPALGACSLVPRCAPLGCLWLAWSGQGWPGLGLRLELSLLSSAGRQHAALAPAPARPAACTLHPPPPTPTPKPPNPAGYSGTMGPDPDCTGVNMLGEACHGWQGADGGNEGGGAMAWHGRRNGRGRGQGREEAEEGADACSLSCVSCGLHDVQTDTTCCKQARFPAWRMGPASPSAPVPMLLQLRTRVTWHQRLRAAVARLPDLRLPFPCPPPHSLLPSPRTCSRSSHHPGRWWQGGCGAGRGAYSTLGWAGQQHGTASWNSPVPGSMINRFAVCAQSRPTAREARINHANAWLNPVPCLFCWPTAAFRSLRRH